MKSRLPVSLAVLAPALAVLALLAYGFSREAPVLEEAWRKFKATGVVFVGINTQDKEEAARDFLDEFSLTYPNGRDPGGKFAIDYGIWGLPESFFIDPAGRITYKHVGAIGWETLVAKADEARRGVASAIEGRGEYKSSR